MGSILYREQASSIIYGIIAFILYKMLQCVLRKEKMMFKWIILTAIPIVMYASQIDMLTKACQEEHGAACYELGLIYQEGIGVDQNLSKAKTYFNKSCDLNTHVGCDAAEKIIGSRLVQEV